MFKTTIKFNPQIERTLISMSEMKPCDIGIIQEESFIGHLVMRTSSKSKFEVIDLSSFRPDNCWIDKPDILVKLIPQNTSVTITFKQEN